MKHPAFKRAKVARLGGSRAAIQNSICQAWVWQKFNPPHQFKFPFLDRVAHIERTRMTAMSSVRRARPSRVVKGGTDTTRKHRFQSFNQRIAKLKIDPVHRGRLPDLDDSTAASYFQTTLDRWKDLNVSEGFSDFVKEVKPYCESLPQILHYQEDIMSALVRYLEKWDPLSLEPLLDLLSNFAHDLGTRFECYFAKALGLVSSLAARHPDVEVIEWSFECLAWLFKYLSRLLVPDLRPVFEIMGPLLGKEPQKTHTARFAAEALSFLIRKAATVYHKNPTPLDQIVQYIVNDLTSLDVSSTSHDLYQHGLMMLFVESVKGIERRLHSTAVQVYRCLLEHTIMPIGDERGKGTEKGADLLYGITIGVLQITDAHNFQPILEIFLEHIRALNLGSKDANIGSCGYLLFIAVSVRKGSRIADWAPVLDALLTLLELCDISSNKTVANIYKAAAVALSLSPLELVISRLRAAMGVIAHRRHVQHFLAFCNDICSLNRDRFHSLVFPYFNK